MCSKICNSSITFFQIDSNGNCIVPAYVYKDLKLLEDQEEVIIKNRKLICLFFPSPSSEPDLITTYQERIASIFYKTNNEDTQPIVWVFAHKNISEELIHRFPDLPDTFLYENKSVEIPELACVLDFSKEKVCIRKSAA